VLTFLPKLFAQTYAGGPNTGTAVGGWLTTLALIVGLAGMFTAGRAVDRGARTPAVLLAGALGQAPFLALVGLIAGPALLPLMMATAFFHFFTQPPGNHLVAELVPARLRGLGYGLYFAVAFGVGSSGAVLGGWLSERVGLARAFGALSAALVPGIVAAGWLVAAGRGGLLGRDRID
jgi:MFS family permease